MSTPQHTFIPSNVREKTHKKTTPLSGTAQTFRLLIENATDIITVLDVKGTVRYDNPRITEMFGYTQEERVGTSAFDFIHPEDVQRVQKVFTELLTEPDGIRSVAFRYRHKNGTWKHLESVGVNLLRDPVIEGVLVSSRDVTQKTEAHHELQEKVEERTAELQKANEQLREEHARMAFLAEAGALLSSSLEYRETLQNVASMVVPTYADWCTIDMVDEKGTLQKFTVAHKDPEKVTLANAIHDKYPPRKDAKNGVYEAMRTGKTLFVQNINPEMLVSVAQDEEHLKMIQKAGLTSAIIVPLMSEGQALGAMTFIRSDKKNKYVEDDVHFVEQLAHKATLAIRNAQLFTQAQEELEKRRVLESKWMRTYRELNKANRLLTHHIDELEYTKEQMEHEKVKAEAILESIGEGLVVTDNEDHIVLTNHISETILRYPRGEMIGKHAVDVLKMVDEQGALVPLDKRPLGRAGKDHVSHITTSDNRYYVRSDGTRFPVSTIASPVILKGKMRGKVVVFKDVTKEKEIDEAKNEFISIASHQLRTPLSTINWYAETLLMRAGKDEGGKNVKYLRQIHTANQRLIRLVNSLLNVSRLELGTVVIEPQPTHVVRLVQEVVADLKGDVAENQVVLKEEYEEDLPHVQLDPRITQIVVQNLISNALKYIPESRQEKWVQVRVYAGAPPSRGKSPSRDKEKGIIIQVRDNGYGISREDRSKIFSKFFRCDVTRESNHEGSGLGLYIAKQLTELMGGKIWLKSQVGKGTAFYVYLPKENTRVQLQLQQEKIEQ